MAEVAVTVQDGWTIEVSPSLSEVQLISLEICGARDLDLG